MVLQCCVRRACVCSHVHMCAMLHIVCAILQRMPVRLQQVAVALCSTVAQRGSRWVSRSVARRSVRMHRETVRGAVRSLAVHETVHRDAVLYRVIVCRRRRGGQDAARKTDRVVLSFRSLRCLPKRRL
jgi:hypothetical protein